MDPKDTSYRVGNNWDFKKTIFHNTDPQFCLPCHSGDARDEHRNDTPDVVLTGTGNCYNCHNRRESWSRNCGDCGP